jgi:hypothetical protein
VIAPDRRFLEPAEGSPRLVEPLGVATADRFRLAQGRREIVGAWLALAVEEGAPEGPFHRLFDLGPRVALALRDEPREVEPQRIAAAFPQADSQICRRSSAVGTSNHQTASRRLRNSAGITNNMSFSRDSRLGGLLLSA